MRKKIFAFVGSRSSRKNTYKLVKKIISEIDKTVKSDYEILTLNDINIKPCVGCSSCFRVGECVQKDELSVLKDKILESDLFIVAAPVYMHGLPGEMKNIIDRLATWSHTFRLTGKNVLVASTCDTNGHSTVVDDLHLKMLYMGGRVIGKYVGTNHIPEDLNIDSNVVLLENIEKDIPNLVGKTIENWASPMKSNSFNESLFKLYQDNQKYLIDIDMKNGETIYWIESGMIECNSFQEYLDIVLKKGRVKVV